MKIQRITKIARGQDGAIWDKYLFRFQLDGSCHVYDLENIQPVVPGGYHKALGVFDLDKLELIAPHCNSVFFGTEYYTPEDAFPLLYSNVYNNYAKQADQHKGMCCVYRLQRNGDQFYTTLVQVIQISFTEDASLWCSSSRNDVRPYGNFVIDREQRRLLAFTMVDEPRVTRFFSFAVPKPTDGTVDEQLGVPVVKLSAEDILEQFDCPYQNYIQGTCCHNSVIYSLEGLASTPEEHAVALFSTTEKCQLSKNFFAPHGLTVEPEMIDFMGDTCYFADNFGNLYTLCFFEKEGMH